MLNINFPKNKPLKINDRKYKHFNQVSLKEDLKTRFSNHDIQTCKDVEQIVLIIPDNNAPLKKQDFKSTIMHHLLLNKYSLAIIERFQLEIIYLKKLTDNIRNTKINANRLRKKKKTYFISLNSSFQRTGNFGKQ